MNLQERAEFTVEIAGELYDRFVMGGWEPQDAYAQIDRWLRKFDESRWIPVGERLPEGFEQVFVYLTPVAEGPNWYPRTNVALAWHKRSDIWFGAFVDPMSGNVENGEFPEGLITHWMPLPEKP